MSDIDLEKPATVDLTGSGSVSEMAQREGWDPDLYALALSENIRNSGMSLDLSRERLASLAQVAAGLAGDQASADELARHFSILEALYHRFARAAVEAMGSDRQRASEIADRYLSAALKAQRGAMACLSALKVLRDGHQPPTTTTAASAPAAVTSLGTTQ